MKGDTTEAALPCNYNALKKVLKDRLSAKICYIFHSMFYCEQVLYMTNQQTPEFRDI